MDEADRACIQQANELNAALADAQNFIPRRTVTSWEEGPLFCEECGELIPETRRRALPGTLYCRECAEHLY